jgi:hypothetical protein
MIYELEQARARRAFRLAKTELRQCERRFDRYRGPDRLRFVEEIKVAELRVREARASLRQVEDGRTERLPQTEPDTTAPAPRSSSRGG